jgi:hypothetical protein
MGKKRPEIKKEYMEVLRPCLHFHGIQIKSEECFRKFAAAVYEIEALTGIHATTISLEDIFLCPDIDLDAFMYVEPPMTSMERLLIGIIKQMDGSKNATP